MDNTIQYNTILNGDCLDLLPHVADGSVDMILCDLPYGTTHCKWDVVIPFDQLWQHYLRIIKDNGAIVLTAQQPFATDLINSCRKYFRYEIIWEKTQKLGFLNANKMPLRGHENVLIFYKKSPTYNPQKYMLPEDQITKPRIRKLSERRYQGYGQYNDSTYTDIGERFPHSVIKISNWNGALFGKTQRAVKHPTQKPVELFAWLIRTFTNPGDLVVDNCSGSGTTAVACIREGRKYICMEKDPGYFEYTKEREAAELDAAGMSFIEQ